MTICFDHVRYQTSVKYREKGTDEQDESNRESRFIPRRLP